MPHRTNHTSHRPDDNPLGLTVAKLTQRYWDEYDEATGATLADDDTRPIPTTRPQPAVDPRTAQLMVPNMLRVVLPELAR